MCIATVVEQTTLFATSAFNKYIIYIKKKRKKKTNYAHAGYRRWKHPRVKTKLLRWLRSTIIGLLVPSVVRGYAYSYTADYTSSYSPRCHFPFALAATRTRITEARLSSRISGSSSTFQPADFPFRVNSFLSLAIINGRTLEQG